MRESHSFANVCAFFISGAFLVLWTGHVTTLHRLKETVIDKDVLDNQTWANLLQLGTIRDAMFTVKVHERIGRINKY